MTELAIHLVFVFSIIISGDILNRDCHAKLDIMLKHITVELS